MKRVLTLLVLALCATTHDSHGMQYLKKAGLLAKKGWQATSKPRTFLRKPVVQMGVGLALYAGAYAQWNTQIETKFDMALQKRFPKNCKLEKFIAHTQKELARQKALSWIESLTDSGDYDETKKTLACLQSAQQQIREIEKNAGICDAQWYVSPYLSHASHALTKRIALNINLENPAHPINTGLAYHEVRHAKSLGCKAAGIKALYRLAFPALYAASCFVPALRFLNIPGRIMGVTASGALGFWALQRQEEILADSYSLCAIENDLEALKATRDWHARAEKNINNWRMTVNVGKHSLALPQALVHLWFDPLHPRAKNRAALYQQAIDKLEHTHAQNKQQPVLTPVTPKQETK